LIEEIKKHLAEKLLSKNTNENKRTLCYLASEPIGIVDTLLEVGSIYQFSVDVAPLVCAVILNYPTNSENNVKDFFEQNGCLKVAYFNYVDGISNDPKYKRKTSQKQEKKLAKKAQGKLQPSSGAMAFFKGDVTTEFFLIEAKYTDKDFYRLQLKIWNKIKKEALNKNKIPLMEICLSQNSNALKIIIVDSMDFHDITGIDEERLIQNFYSTALNSDKQSIQLKHVFFHNHIYKSDYQNGKIPHFLINIDKNLLFGFTTDDFFEIVQK